MEKEKLMTLENEGSGNVAVANMFLEQGGDEETADRMAAGEPESDDMVKFLYKLCLRSLPIPKLIE